MTPNSRTPLSPGSRLAAVLLIVGTTVHVAATETAAQGLAQQSLDEQLLEELGGDLLDELERPEEPGPNPRDAEPPQAEPEGEPREPDAIPDGLGEAAVSDRDQPLLAVGEAMREVQAQLAQGRLGGGTQKRQREIVDRLAEMIQQVQQNRQSAAASNQQQVASRQQVTQPQQKPQSGDPSQPRAKSRPSQTSNAKPGQTAGKAVDMDQMRAVLRELWGRLPERARQQMLELPVEQFLPEYEEMIEEYFRRLAEEEGNE